MPSGKSVGLSLLAVGVSLPVIAYFVGHFYNVNLSSLGGPPDQGAMVITYFAFLASLAVGACMALVGIAIAVISTRKSTSHPSRIEPGG